MCRATPQVRSVVRTGPDRGQESHPCLLCGCRDLGALGSSSTPSRRRSRELDGIGWELEQPVALNKLLNGGNHLKCKTTLHTHRPHPSSAEPAWALLAGPDTCSKGGQGLVEPQGHQRWVGCSRGLAGGHLMDPGWTLWPAPQAGPRVAARRAGPEPRWAAWLRLRRLQTRPQQCPARARQGRAPRDPHVLPGAGGAARRASDGWRPGEAVALATAQSPWQPGAPARGGGAARSFSRPRPGRQALLRGPRDAG